jgi:hypothetical protein
MELNRSNSNLELREAEEETEVELACDASNLDDEMVELNQQQLLVIQLNLQSKSMQR